MSTIFFVFGFCQAVGKIRFCKERKAPPERTTSAVSDGRWLRLAAYFARFRMPSSLP